MISRLTFIILYFLILKLGLHGFDFKIPKNVQVGIIVQSISDKEVIYELNADQLFMPSSTLKVLTAITALKRLGPDFTYSTELRVENNCEGTEANNVYIKFSGDPTLKGEDLKKLLKKLHEIKGDIVYDYSGFKVPSINPSWMISDMEQCEMVPLSNAIIDKNYYHFEIHPGKELFEPALLKTETGLWPRYGIDNRVITVKNEDYKWRSYGFQDDNLVIRGKVGVELKPQRIELPIDDLDFYIQQNLLKALEENEIIFEGEIRSGITPNNTIVIGEHRSRALKEILAEGLKYSHNIPFGMLLLQLGALDNAALRTWDEAANVMVKDLNNYYSIDLSQAVINDGIGLSRYNLLSPRQLLEILIAAYQDPKISSDIMECMAQNGKPGFLQNRLTEEELKGRVYAKTGSMSGISTIGGYLITKKGNTLAFVIFVNNFLDSTKPYRDFQDEVCRILIESL